MVAQRLGAAAAAVRAHDSRRALELLLAASAELRSDELTARIERTAARVAELGPMLAAVPPDPDRADRGVGPVRAWTAEERAALAALDDALAETPVDAAREALVAHLALRPVPEILDELERAIRARGDRAHLLSLANSLVPRVFGSTRAVTLDPDQRRLAHALRYLRRPHLERLGHPAAVSMLAARAALGIANRPLGVAPSLPLAAWTFARHDELRGPGEVTEVPGVFIVDGRGGVRGAVITADPSAYGDVLAGTGLVALRGGVAMVAWLAAGGDCASVRVLLIDVAADVAALADAPILSRIRRLEIVRDDAAQLLAAPALRGLEALSCAWPSQAALAALAQLPALRELRLGAPLPGADVGAFVATTRAPLRVLELASAAVAIDVLVGNPALAGLEELALDHCDLTGGDLLAGLGELRVFRASGSTLDDTGADSLARCAKLELVDLSGTLVRSLAALARIARIPALVTLRVPPHVLVELAVAARAMRGVAVPTLAQVRALEPGWPRCTRERAAALPEPPAGWTRRFVVDELATCPRCSGTGRTPDERACPSHRETEHVVHDGPLPDHPTDLDHFLRAAATVADVEDLVAGFAAELPEGARPREIVYTLSPRPRPPSRVDALAGATPLADTVWWPHAAHVAAPSTLLARLARVVDHGFAIHAITATAVHLAPPRLWHVTRRAGR